MIKQAARTVSVLVVSTACAFYCVAALAQSNPNGSEKTVAKPDWEVSVGFGVAAYPTFIGSKSQRTLPLPIIDATYKETYFISTFDGIGAKTKFNGLTLSAAIGLDFAARDSKNAKNTRLAGLTNVKEAPALILKADYETGPFFATATYSNRLGDKKTNGGSLALEGGIGGPINSQLSLSGGFTARTVDTKFANNLLSISAADSITSGLPEFKAKSGLLEAGGFVQAAYSIDKHWAIKGRLTATQLQKDFAKSPIVEKKNQSAVNLLVVYTF